MPPESESVRAAVKQKLPDDASSNLDLLRSFAVTLVFFAHFVETLTRGASTPFAGYFGWFGVIAFFVHTALVLMRSLERLDSDSRGRIGLRFYIRRIFRIYPLSIVWVLLVTSLSIPSMPGDFFVQPSRAVVIANLMLMQNVFQMADVLGPLWSLPFEVQMYLVLPACYFVLRRAKIWSLPLIWIAGILLLLTPVAAIHYVVRWSPCFLAGVTVYAWQKKFTARFLPAWMFAAVLAVESVIYASAQMWAQSIGHYALTVLFVNNWLAAVAVAWAILVSREISSKIVWNMAHKVAKYSYGIYLAHVPLLWLAFRALNPLFPFWIRITVFAITSMAVPVIAYHFFEAPLIDRGREVAARLTRSPESFSAAVW
jgi:peptidoglycan/LPS O-acetylase OafA/YrhL